MAARDAMTIVGKVINPKVKPPTKGADLGKSKKLRKIARPRSPKTIEGTAARLLILVSIISANLFFLAIFSRYSAVSTPIGKALINAINMA